MNEGPTISVGENSSILASPLVFLPSLDHLIRSRQHVGIVEPICLAAQIDDKLKLRRLLHREFGRLGAFPMNLHVQDDTHGMALCALRART
jgi:hypothetical protein